MKFLSGEKKPVRESLISATLAPPSDEEKETKKELKELIIPLANSTNVPISETKILRFLRPRDKKSALKAWSDHIEWYTKNDVANIDNNKSQIQKELASKIMIYGNDFRDNTPNPVLYFVARRFTWSEGMKLYIIHTFENLMNNLVQTESENFRLVFDLTGFNVLMINYEFLAYFFDMIKYNNSSAIGGVLIVNAPFIFSGCWVIIKNMLPSEIAAEVNFVNMKTLQDYMSCLPQEIGQKD